MYTEAHCSDPPAMLLLFGGTDTSYGEYEGVVRALEDLYRAAKGREAFVVVVVPREHRQPNAYWRRRIAEVHAQSDGPMHVGIVTESTFIRGVITAINWLIRPRPTYHSYTFDSVEGAAAKFGAIEPRMLDALRALHLEAQPKMRDGLRSAHDP